MRITGPNYPSHVVVMGDGFPWVDAASVRGEDGRSASCHIGTGRSQLMLVLFDDLHSKGRGAELEVGRALAVTALSPLVSDSLVAPIVNGVVREDLNLAYLTGTPRWGTEYEVSRYMLDGEWYAALPSPVQGFALRIECPTTLLGSGVALVDFVRFKVIDDDQASI